MFRSFAVLVLSASVAHAALPPGSYDKLRAKAPDAVTIQVTGVKEETTGARKHVTLEAKVLGVERSNSGLKIGDAVTIRYAVELVPLPGPKPIPVLVKDGVYPAFLEKKADGFAPAAFGESFRMTPEG